MRFIAATLGGLALGLALYAIMALALVTPESQLLQSTVDMERLKLHRLEDPDRPPHLIVASGSNALYSIDSAALSQQVGRPVTNAAMQWNFAFLAMEGVAQRVKPGDWVMLPLEWVFWDQLTQRSPIEACYVIAHRRERLRAAGDWLAALTECNPKMLLMAARQRLMRFAGFNFPNPDMATLISPEGDLLDNTPDKAIFTQWVTPSRVTVAASSLPDWNLAAPVMRSLHGVTATLADPQATRYPRLEAVIAAIRERGGRVFVTFPVSARAVPGYDVPSQPPAWVDDRWFQSITAWAGQMGAEVISHPQNHLYAPDCLFDSGYHLHRGCTPENTRRYGDAILRAVARQ